MCVVVAALRSHPGLQQERAGRAPEREEFNNDRNFSKVMHKYQGDLIDEAKSIAEKEGYNAIIGSKFLVNTHSGCCKSWSS